MIKRLKRRWFIPKKKNSFKRKPQTIKKEGENKLWLRLVSSSMEDHSND